MIIDSQGRIFGKINLFDLFVVIVLIGLIPMFWFGYKMITAKPPPESIPITYTIIYQCPNCFKNFSVAISLGEPMPENYEKICPLCQNKVILNPKSEVKEFKPNKELTYQEQYYKSLLESKQ